jgi:NAD(P)H-dependent flavin oxidoreductase YrpB (nitropropane dioxygenase family)
LPSSQWRNEVRALGRGSQQTEWMGICLEEQAPLLVFVWGELRPYIQEAHRRGITVFRQVGSVEEAQAAIEAGVDGIIAQRLEAGGHLRSTTVLSILLPAVVETVAPVPVIAAGDPCVTDQRNSTSRLHRSAPQPANIRWLSIPEGR